jgi:hypothetical protein
MSKFKEYISNNFIFDIQENKVIINEKSKENNIVTNNIYIPTNPIKKDNTKDDNNIYIYISKFKKEERYTNDKRINIYTEVFRSNLTDRQIAKIINPDFNTSSVR